MHRRSMRSAVVLVAVATLTLAACGSKSTDSDIQQRSAGGQRLCGVRQCGRIRRRVAGGALAIKAELQIDKEGTEVAVDDRRHPGQPGR